ncbi:MAG: serine/threonine-protein kinase [Planctomycetota bacterium]
MTDRREQSGESEEPTLPPKSEHDDATLPPDQATPWEANRPAAVGNGTGQTVERIGAYELIEEIARGGMGVVFKAKHTQLNRVAAVKMILGGRFSSEADVRRFQIEAEAAAKLDHPGIVPVYDIGEHEGQPFFAMKFIDGDSLAQRLGDYRGNDKEIASLLARVARAVYHAHQRGILHRDLKPANILIGQGGEPLITDLGLAKSTVDDSQITNTGTVLGTPSYMSPEQARGETSLTVASDVFSLGAILYELLTGKPPHRAGSSIETVLSVINQPAEAPRSLNPDIARDLELICLKCLEKNPEDRYSSSADLARDLENWVAGDAISVRTPSLASLAVRWVRRNPRVLYLVLASLFAVALAFPTFTALFGDLYTLGQVYREFPDTKRPLIFSFPRPSDSLINYVSIALLFLIWPGIGWVNALVTNPRSILSALWAGGLTAVFVSMLGFLATGWLFVVFGVSDNATDQVKVLSEAIWPPEGATTEETLERANQVFRGVEVIPVEERAKAVTDRIAADQIALAPTILFIIGFLSMVFTSPIVFGTVLAHVLIRRPHLPRWLAVARYFIAWICVLFIIAIATTGLGDGIVFGFRVWQYPWIFLGVCIGCFVVAVLVMRRWVSSSASR